MKDYIDEEYNLKSINFSKKYENGNNYKNYNKNTINTESIKQKLNIFEKNLKNQLNGKKIQNNENNFANSSFKREPKNINPKQTNYSHLNDDEMNTSLKLMDLKLNQDIFKNKIENFGKRLLEDKQNYHTISNDLDYVLNHKQENYFNYQQNLKNTQLTDHDDRFKFKTLTRNKENKFLNNDEKRNFTLSNYKENFDRDKDYNKNKKDKYSENENFIEKFGRKTMNPNLGNYEKYSEISYKSHKSKLNKTDGHIDIDETKTPLKMNHKINNNDLKFDYAKNELEELENKIKSTKEKLNECLQKTETIIIDKKNIRESIKNSRILNEEEERYINRKTNDKKEHYNDFRKTGNFDNFREEKNSNSSLNGEEYIPTKFNTKKDYKKNRNLHKNNDSSASSSDNLCENKEIPKFRDSFKLMNRNSQPYKNYKSETNTSRNNEKFDPNQSNRRTVLNKPININQDNYLTMDAILNTRNNTIKIMDNIKISENAKKKKKNVHKLEELEELERMSDVNLNISGIATDIFNINSEINVNEKRDKISNFEGHFNNFAKKDENKYKIDDVYEKEIKSFHQFLEINKKLANKTLLDENEERANDINKNLESFNSKRTKKEKRENFENRDVIHENNFNFLNQNEQNFNNFNNINMMNLDSKRSNLERFPSSKYGSDINSFYDSNEKGKIEKDLSKIENVYFKQKFNENINQNVSMNSNRIVNSKNKTNEESKRINPLEYNISPIKTTEKFRYTEKELDEIVSKYMEDKTNFGINQKKNFSLNKNIKDNNSRLEENYNEKMKNYIIEEIKEKKLDMFKNKVENLENNYIPERHTVVEKSKKNRNNFENDSEKKENIRNNSDISETPDKINDIINKIPQIVGEFQNKKEKISNNGKDVDDHDKNLLNFFNLGNLGNLIDWTKLNFGNFNMKQPESKPIYGKIAKKDIINEADNIINSHVIKNTNNKKISEQKIENFEINNGNLINMKNDESLEGKINYIYDMLKNLQNLKLIENFNKGEDNRKSNLFKESKTKEKPLNDNVDNFFVLDNNKISFEVPKNIFRFNNEQNENRQSLQNVQNMHNTSSSDKKKIDDYDDKLLEEAQDILLSPSSKFAIEDAMKLNLLTKNKTELKSNTKDNDIEQKFKDNNLSLVIKDDNFNTSKISDIKKIDNSINNFNSNNASLTERNTAKFNEGYNLIEKRIEKIIENKIFFPNDIIKKRVEKIIPDKIITNRPEAEIESEFNFSKNENKRDILKKKVNFSKSENSVNNQQLKSIPLNIIENGNNEIEEDSNELSEDENYNINYSSNKKIINISHNSNIPANGNFVDSVTKKIDFSANNLENSEEENDEEEEKQEQEEEQGKNIYCEDEQLLFDEMLSGKIDKANAENDGLKKMILKSNLKKGSCLKKDEFEKNNQEVSDEENIKRVKFDSVRENKDQINTSDEDQENLDIIEDDIDKILINKSSNVISDIPIENNKKDNRVNFSNKLIFIEYEDDSYAEDIKVSNQIGKTEKHKKFNMLAYLNKIRNNKYRTKKILHYYYNGLRDDKLPKKLLSSLKKSNSFSEQDKELGLKKLNEFLDECNKENPALELETKKRNEIVQRNLNKIHEIEEARKSGKKYRPAKSPTPRKNINSSICKKFQGDPTKFFSKNPPDSVLKSFNVKNEASGMKFSKSEGKLMEINGFSNTMNVKKVNKYGISELNQNKKLENRKKNPNLQEFNLNSQPSLKNERETALKNLISNVNLEESLEGDADKIENEDNLNGSFNSYNVSPNKDRFFKENF